MKIYIKLMLFVAVIVAAAGCERIKVSGLDDSVDARINTLIDGYVDELIESQYGWMMSINTNKGYYRFWMKFYEEGGVEMMTDNLNYSKLKTESQTSTYVFRAFQRPTLVFDTYSYIHYINDPDNTISGGTKNQGLKTDFEFEVVRYDADAEEFYMQGRFSKVNARMRKASKADMDGAAKGLLMDRLSEVSTDTRWANRYICGKYEDTEIAVKLADRRILYQFWYDYSTDKGVDELGYFNVEVDRSDDLFFPEPIELNDVSLTGLKYDANLKDFKSFYTKEGEEVPVTVSNTAPDIRLSNIFGIMGEEKMFDAAYTPSGLVSELGSGTTYSALFLFPRFVSYNASFNLVFSYDQHYYFTSELVNKGGEQRLIYYFNIMMAPVGFGVDISGGQENWEPINAYPVANYRFEIIDFDRENLTFKLPSGYTANKGASDYYAGRVTNDMIDGFSGRTLKMEWSETPLNEGLIVEFRDVSLNASDTHKTAFIPPAILYSRTK